MNGSEIGLSEKIQTILNHKETVSARNSELKNLFLQKEIKHSVSNILDLAEFVSQNIFFNSNSCDIVNGDGS